MEDFWITWFSGKTEGGIRAQVYEKIGTKVRSKEYYRFS